VKRIRGEVQETREMLDAKELENRNLKRDLEVKAFEFKSLEARFAKQQKTSD
jgi:hypothetical protein